VLYFSAFAIFQALVERFAFLDYANSLYDVGYLFGLNNNCLALCLASPSNASQFVFGKPFANMTLSETCFPLFTVSMRCPSFTTNAEAEVVENMSEIAVVTNSSRRLTPGEDFASSRVSTATMAFLDPCIRGFPDGGLNTG
jgi:hypothetical protein